MQQRLPIPWTILVGIMAACCAFAGAEPLPPLPEGAFSIVALPDTQQYSATLPDVFDAEMQWILDNIEGQNIVFVSQVGDVVDDRTKPEQWEVAGRCMRRLLGRVPFGIAPGNHDMSSAGDTTQFQTVFPESLFAGQPWYGGALKNNANSWQTFRAADTDFVIVHIECNAPDDVLAWADRVLEDHAGSPAIITTHMYLGPIAKPQAAEDFHTAPKGRMQWKKCHGKAGNTPQEMWDKCFSKHPNVFMILSGDQSRTQAFYQASTGQHGNVVHELMSDYREGYLRVYRFLPAEQRLQIFTYSPTLGALCEKTAVCPRRDQHQFSVECVIPGMATQADKAAARAPVAGPVHPAPLLRLAAGQRVF